MSITDLLQLAMSILGNLGFGNVFVSDVKTVIVRELDGR